MSDAEDTAAPRRSQREKKQAAQFISANSLKRKRSDVTTQDEVNDEQSELSEPEDSDKSDDQNEEVEEDYAGSKPKPKGRPSMNKASAAKAVPKRKGPPPVKKPKATKTTTTTPRPKKISGAKRGRKPAALTEGAAFDAEEVAKETKVAGDNVLFNAVMNPSAALQSTAEDFLDSLTNTPEPAQADLINCILRACGCNHALEPHEAVDYDGVVDVLDNITEALKQDDTFVYPLTSKFPAFKRFRKSLSEFLTRVVTSAAALGSLYTSDLLPTLQTWVVAMSSSHLRAFRHTATVVAMEVETALCEVAAEVEKEAEVVSRQREGEKKRRKEREKTKSVSKGEPSTAREKELEAKAAEVRERRTKLAEFLKEFVDGVFVHRYRDLDPNIRAECVRAMGLWFSKYPAHFLDGTYLRYVGWVLSDTSTPVRLEAVKALQLAYAQSSYVAGGSLQHFTERFKPRLVEMALSDTELSIRVAVIAVLQAIDGHGLLEDTQRERLCLLLFDEKLRVRKAVAGFVKGVWEEKVNERLVGRRPAPDAKDKKRARVKAFLMLLVSWGRMLDRKGGPRSDEEMDVDDEGDTRSEGSSKGRGKEVAALVGPEQKGRTALAVEALWDEVEAVKDWETALEMLVLDHSAAREEASSRGRGRKKKSVVSGAGVDEAWRLEEVEEGVLLEVLIASVQKAKADAVSGKKGEEEIVVSETTRALIQALPQLFVKYQTDDKKITGVLRIPQLMNLDMYLEMRMMTAYASLWDDITKQLLSHSSPSVLGTAVTTLRTLISNPSLSNTNTTKIIELEEELTNALKDITAGRDQLSLAALDEDEVLALEATLARVAALANVRDICAWIEDDDSGKQTSSWEIVSAIAERGKLGYKAEEPMVEHALQLLTLHVMWKTKGLTATEEPSPEETQLREKLKEYRDSLVQKLIEVTTGVRANTGEVVRRAAFQNLMDLHILFSKPLSEGPALPTSSMPLTLDDEVQGGCAVFIQAEIERYAEVLEEAVVHDNNSGSDHEDSDSDEERPMVKRGKKGKAKQSGPEEVSDKSKLNLEREYVFMGIIASFLRAVRAGVIHVRHAAVLLTNYGRLGPWFDMCTKVIVDILREEGMYRNNGEMVAAIVIYSLRESFLLYIDGLTRSEDHSVALAKALSPCFVVRGAQLSVVWRMPSQYVVQVHNDSISWICKRIGAYETAKNKNAKNKSITFFRVLQPLLSNVDARDALEIKAHLDQAVAQAKIEIPATSKFWDAYRAYEKRLVTSKGIKGPGPKKKFKTAEIISTDEEDATEVEGPTTEDERPASKAKPKPRAARKTRAYKTTDDEQSAPEDDPLPASPQTGERPKRKQWGASRSPSVLSELPSTPRAASVVPMDELSAPATPASQEPEDEGATTPVASRKRARSPEEPEESGSDVPGDVQSSPAGPSGSQGTDDGEMQIKRRRVRH